MIEHLTDLPDNIVAFRCSGRVTKTDYDSILEPAVLDALHRHGRARLYYVTGADFAGFDVRAMWKDFKIGVGHLTRWERVAVVSDVEWIKNAMRFFGFLMPAASFPCAMPPGRARGYPLNRRRKMKACQLQDIVKEVQGLEPLRTAVVHPVDEISRPMASWWWRVSAAGPACVA